MTTQRAQTQTIYCAGSILWDTIGRAPHAMSQGQDVGGRIRRLPGGVGMNIAMALRAQDQAVALLSVLGNDTEGRALIEEAKARQIGSDLIHISDSLPTDQYMAIEANNGLIAAIADAHSLEKLSEQALQPLSDGRLGTSTEPYQGMLVLEGNLTTAAMAAARSDGLLKKADVRLAPASPGKAERMRVFLGTDQATLYVNLEEANIILDQNHLVSSSAAEALVHAGIGRAIVTDGAKPLAMATTETTLSADPKPVLVKRVTGAGDVLMASHIAAERQGLNGQAALDRCLDRVALYISTEVPL